jgi:hypothetical protein
MSISLLTIFYSIFICTIILSVTFGWAGEVEIPVTITDRQKTEMLVISWNDTEGKIIATMILNWHHSMYTHIRMHAIKRLV